MASKGIVPYTFLSNCNLEVIPYSCFMCLLSNQPPTSAKSVFLLACKSIRILPHASFSITPLLFLTQTVSVASSFCSHSFCIIHILTARGIFPKRELSLLYWHPFNGSHHLLQKFCISQQSMQDSLSSGPSSHLWCHYHPPPSFTLGYIALQPSDLALLKYLPFTKVLCLISASVLQHQCGAIACSSSSAENTLIQMAPQPGKLQVLLQHSV